MPTYDDPPDTSPSTGTPSAGGSGPQLVQDVLSTAAGALGAAGAAVELFATPSPFRNTVLIVNNGSGEMVIGFTSDVSSTKHSYKLASGGNALLNVSAQVRIWVRPDATGNNYTAHEMRVR